MGNVVKEDTPESLMKDSNDKLGKHSTTLSTICRGVTYTIIAVVWGLSLVERSLVLPQGWLLVAMAVSFMYLFIDLLHYFLGACFHFFEAHTLYIKKDEYVETHKAKATGMSICTFVFLILKFLLCLGEMVFFGMGIVSLAH